LRSIRVQALEALDFAVADSVADRSALLDDLLAARLLIATALLAGDAGASWA